MTRQTKAQLEEQVSRLQADNIALKNELTVQTLAAPEDQSGGSSQPRKPRGRSWTVLATALILVGAMLAPVAIVANWAKLQLSDTTTFVDTFAPLAQDPKVQAFITTEVVAAIDQQVNIDQLTSSVFDSISDLGLPPAGAAALGAFEGVAANGVRSVMTNAVSSFMQSDAFADVWRQALTISHSQLIAAMQNDPNAALTLSNNGEVGIALGPIIEEVKTVLVEQGVTFASSIPTIDKTIVLAESDAVVQAQLGYNLAIALGSWLSWIALFFLAAGVLVARRRSLALIWAAAALGFVMILTASGVAVGRLVFIGIVSPAYLPSDVAGIIYTQILELVQSSSTATAVLAVVIAVVAWLSGPYRAPRALRSVTVAGAARLRNAAQSSGFTTGRFGELAYKFRYVVRAAVAVLGSLIILMNRPLDPTGIFWTLFGAVLVLLVLELVQRPTDELEKPDVVTAS